MMSVLKALTFVPVPRAPKLSPQKLRRLKLIGHLEEQLGLAKAARDGSVFTVKKRRWRLNEWGGKELVEVDKQLRSWWTANEDGSLILTIRWGRGLIEFQRGRAGIAVGDLDGLIRTLQQLIHAVEAGELDAYLVNKEATRFDRRGKS